MLNILKILRSDPRRRAVAEYVGCVNVQPLAFRRQGMFLFNHLKYKAQSNLVFSIFKLFFALLHFIANMYTTCFGLIGQLKLH
jgi:hypothetical protein